MGSHVDVKELSRRPQRYWNIDGLPDLTMGLLWMVWGGMMWAAEAAPAGRLRGVLVIGGVVLFVAGTLGAKWYVRGLKARLTYPRTGYVACAGPSLMSRSVAALLASVCVLAMGWYVSRGWPLEGDRALTTGVVVVLAAVFTISGVRYGWRRHFVLAAAAVGLGVWSISEGGGTDTLNAFFFWLGAAAVVVGAFRLYGYLKEHPRPAEPVV